eukprot:scaffold14916_cov128-Isochrysis_galbana.AAC.8
MTTSFACGKIGSATPHAPRCLAYRLPAGITDAFEACKCRAPERESPPRLTHCCPPCTSTDALDPRPPCRLLEDALADKRSDDSLNCGLVEATADVLVDKGTRVRGLPEAERGLELAHSDGHGSRSPALGLSLFVPISEVRPHLDIVGGQEFRRLCRKPWVAVLPRKRDIPLQRVHVQLALVHLALDHRAALHVDADDVLGELRVELGVVLVLEHEDHVEA